MTDSSRGMKKWMTAALLGLLALGFYTSAFFGLPSGSNGAGPSFDTAKVLPHVNGTLNAVTIVLLLMAWRFIKAGNVAAHRTAMIATLAVSAVFLTSYLTYHMTAPIFEFRGEGLVRPLYYAFLVSHVVLAAVVTPFILITALRGLKRMDDRHRALARWVWPVWMYVAVSGVIVYAMLYHLYV